MEFSIPPKGSIYDKNSNKEFTKQSNKSLEKIINLFNSGLDDQTKIILAVIGGVVLLLIIVIIIVVCVIKKRKEQKELEKEIELKKQLNKNKTGSSEKNEVGFADVLTPNSVLNNLEKSDEAAGNFFKDIKKKNSTIKSQKEKEKLSKATKSQKDINNKIEENNYTKDDGPLDQSNILLVCGMKSYEEIKIDSPEKKFIEVLNKVGTKGTVISGATGVSGVSGISGMSGNANQNAELVPKRKSTIIETDNDSYLKSKIKTIKEEAEQENIIEIIEKEKDMNKDNKRKNSEESKHINTKVEMNYFSNKDRSEPNESFFMNLDETMKQDEYIDNNKISNQHEYPRSIKDKDENLNNNDLVSRHHSVGSKFEIGNRELMTDFDEDEENHKDVEVFKD
jgi:hypothetical protein